MRRICGLFLAVAFGFGVLGCSEAPKPTPPTPPKPIVKTPDKNGGDVKKDDAKAPDVKKDDAKAPEPTK